MASSVDTLADAFNAFGIADEPQNELLFNPTDDQRSIRKGLADVPLYLFRVHTPQSDGTLDKEWARSKDAHAGLTSSGTDLLQRKDPDIVNEISAHLGSDKCEIRRRRYHNLVSWTSSLPFALRRGYYMRNQDKSGEGSLGETKLCIVRTDRFALGTFLRDTYLLDYYSNRLWLGGHPNNLAKTKTLRRNLTRTIDGTEQYYYFGEYLSQGALRINGRCDIVNMSQMNEALLRLSPDLGNPELSWAKWVMKQRAQWLSMNDKEGFTDSDWRVVREIASFFEPEFRVPIAAALVSLHPRRAAYPMALLHQLHEISPHEHHNLTGLAAPAGNKATQANDVTIVIFDRT
ncbi:hypothetical protein PspLS_09369 [Pyricularia sp. CBS 133598]|nr:hypothetical protein PspLS_09369 [Pyricularia sp. CBS 133598]